MQHAQQTVVLTVEVVPDADNLVNIRLIAPPVPDVAHAMVSVQVVAHPVMVIVEKRA